MVFAFKKLEKQDVLHVEILWNSNFSIKSEVLLKDSHAHFVFILNMATFPLY